MSSLSSLGGSSGSGLSGVSTNTSTGFSGLSTSGISFQGLVSGLNTQAIIQGLLAPEQAIVTTLQNQQAQISQEEAAYNTIQSSLLALQTALGSLSPSANSVFDGRTATSSNTSVASASASSSATPGVYSFTVNSLAQAQEVSSQGFDSTTSAITQGTFQFQVGSGPVNTVTIGAGNATLQGLASAINTLNAGVTATIVNDGSSAQGNHLLLTSDQAGTANAVTITNNLAAGSGGAMRPEFGANYVGAAVTGSNWTGSATPTSNNGSGNYTGNKNDTFTFTVTNGGDINNAATTISYSNSDGTITGTLNGGQFAGGASAAVAEGIQLQFAAGGTVTTGQNFTVKGFTPNTQAATNASVTFGSGSGGLTVTSSTNQIDNLYPGVTVNLSGVSTSPISVTVGTNSQATATAIDGFVTAYNQLISYINQNDTFDAQTGQAGILLGDYHATSISDQLGRTVTSVVPGLNAKANELSAVGISVNADGTLGVNNAKLNQALGGQLPGVSADDVRRLFVQDGASSNPGVGFVYAPSSIQGISQPIQVQITQAATQGAATATNALAGSVTLDNTNDTFILAVNGNTSSSITLANGTYTPAQLAQQVQTAVNANSALNGATVTASVNGSNQLVLTSANYGSASNVKIEGGTALSALGFVGSESGTGQDVAGSFTYNGITEAATGNGQYLTSNSSNTYTGGLEVVSTLTPAQITASPEASVTISQGIGAQLGNVLNRMLDPVNGQITLANQSLQTQYDDIGQAITKQQQSMQQEQQTLLQEFTNMEAVLAQLQSAGNALNASLTGFSSSSSSSGK